MALNVKINFSDCYSIETISTDLTVSKFETELIDGKKIPLGISISNKPHQYLPDVYNLAFGPMNEKNEIDDKAKITHANHSKVFSTIIFTALAFLAENPDKFLGIDGSNNARAYLYYRVIQNNYSILTEYFDIYGVNYYVRVLRKTKDTDDGYPIDSKDIEAIPRALKEHEKIAPDKLFNYFIFKIKK